MNNKQQNPEPMKPIKSAGVALALALFSSTSALYAQSAVYLYNSPTWGEGFSSFINPISGLSSTSYVSASVTYDTVLPPNLHHFSSYDYVAQIPADWRFSDGIRQWTPVNSHFTRAMLDTDASGNITAWEYVLFLNPEYTYPEVYLRSSIPGTQGGVSVTFAETAPFATASFLYGPGVDTEWTPTIVPEPGALPLAACASAALAVLRRHPREKKG